jgi:hypothetical protein
MKTERQAFAEAATEILDKLFEGVRDGTINREAFGVNVLRLTSQWVALGMREAVMDHETAQLLIFAKNLPQC